MKTKRSTLDFSILFVSTFVLCAVASSLRAEPIQRIWLSHSSGNTQELTINWESEAPTDAVVEYGDSEGLGQRVTGEDKARRQHVVVPFAPGTGRLYYRVGSGDSASAIYSVQRYPEDEFRVAIIGDWGSGRKLLEEGLPRDAPHILMTVGDNVPNLWNEGKEGTKAFSALIDSHADLFRSIPFMPILGNHDREITARGPKPPEHAVYDIEAMAFREFFALPDDEWKWEIAFPEFNIRFIALDLNHLSDLGTTWQTCHPWKADSEQFQWYKTAIREAREGYVVTLMNESYRALKAAGPTLWMDEYTKGSALVTGFGYFAERAEPAPGFPYYNTSVNGHGTLYLDKTSQFHASVDSYLLLTLKAKGKTMRAELKALDGSGVLDGIDIPQRGRR